MAAVPAMSETLATTERSRTDKLTDDQGDPLKPQHSPHDDRFTEPEADDPDTSPLTAARS